ncbi:MAG: RNA chaperone Hfq [Acidobacterium ailaaui]|nr:RNA chaperone Hfq [Pseudacidobacterium ailaaui]
MADALSLPDTRRLRSGDSALASGTSSANAPSDPASLPATGPRKLVRPPLSARAGTAPFPRRRPSPLLAHQEMQPVPEESSHAETFYLQKQMLAQTPMVFVLEDGQRIEGIIEWYDKDCIKLRPPARVLIYKASIKYLYKEQEQKT